MDSATRVDQDNKRHQNADGKEMRDAVSIRKMPQDDQGIAASILIRAARIVNSTATERFQKSNAMCGL